MRTTRTLLLLLTLLPALSWAQGPILGSRAPKIYTRGTTGVFRDSATGFLKQKSLFGPEEFIGIDSSMVRGLSAKFIIERTYQQSQFNTFRQASNGLYRGVNQPFTIGQTPGLIDSLLGKASRAYVDRIVGSGGDSSKTAYAKNVSDTRYPLATTTAQNFTVRTARASVAQIRADASGTPAEYYQLSDYRRPYLYRKDALDTSTPDDGALVLVTSSGVRYKIVVPDRVLTPQMFGAVGDSLTDDGNALNAWLNASGDWERYAPAGKYRSSIAVARTVGGNFTMRGAGQFRTNFYFSGNTSGISIINPPTNDAERGAGTIVVRDIGIYSSGQKSAGTTALYVTSQHYSRPGPTIQNVAIKVARASANNDWGAGITLFDCSASTLSGLDIWGASMNRMVAIRITGTKNMPVVEHNISNFNIQNVRRAFDIFSTGYPGVEGINLSSGNVPSCFEGIYATSTYGSPVLNLTDVHIYSLGGESLHTEGFQQLKFTGAFFYSNKSDGGVIPQQSVYIKNPIWCRGDLFINTIDNIPVALRLAGVGAGVKLYVSGSAESAQTSLVKVDSAFGSKPRICAERIWTGNTTWGSTSPPAVVGDYLEDCAIFDGQTTRLAGGTVQLTGYVRGDFEKSRARKITSITADLPSGFYTLQGTAGMPTSPSGFNIWLVTINRYEDGSGNAQQWSDITVTDIKTKDRWIGGFDAQTNALVAWKKVTTTTP